MPRPAGLILLVSLVALAACVPVRTPSSPPPGKGLPVNQPFRILKDRVLQGEAEAIAVSARELSSNYYGSRRSWKQQRDLSALPAFSAPGSPLLETLYNLALEEALLDIRGDGAFMAGAKWTGVWTRDISYSIHLALGLVFPEASVKSLRAKVNALPEVIQDTGTGGSWPVSTDRVVWAIAAWEVYLSTGDRAWLGYAYEVLANTARRDRPVAWDPATGLYRGESSFMDWREQTYPSWMEPVDIYESKALGTNALHYRLLAVLARMAELLGKPAAEARVFADQAAALKKAINDKLWLADKNYYSAYRYPEILDVLSDKSDSLGEALTVLFGVAEGARASAVLARTPLVHFGVPCIWPQQPSPMPYHNKGIWPFVAAYYAWAGADGGNAAAAEHAFRGIVRAAALFLTHKENFVFDTGHSEGTAINSDRQIWSVAGYLSCVYRLLFGIRVDVDGLSFAPAVPSFAAGPLELKGFPWRGARLDIRVSGQGTVLRSLVVDGVPRPAGYKLPTTLAGAHRVEIVVGPAADPGRINLASTAAVAADDVYPRTTLAKDGAIGLRWRKYPDAASFTLRKNGVDRALDGNTATDRYETRTLPRAWHYAVRVLGKGGFPSNWSAAVFVNPDDAFLLYPAEDAKGAVEKKEYRGYTGDGYALHERKSKPLVFKVKIPETGTWLLRFRYANGNGPINTDNKCAIRTLAVGGKPAGAVVMPQRGHTYWSGWGHSNPLFLELAAGKHEIELAWSPAVANMSGYNDTVALDRLELVRWK